MANLDESLKKQREIVMFHFGTPIDRISPVRSGVKGEWWKTDKDKLVHICCDITEMDGHPYCVARPYKKGHYCPGCNARMMRDV